ncbi:Nn.00g087230.m01.CDS01 [Neocucurbitaria sp. VM-36]
MRYVSNLELDIAMNPNAHKSKTTNVQLRNDRIDRRRRPQIDWQYWPDTTTQQDDATHNIPGLDITNRPDIEDDTIIAWGLTQSETTTGLKVDIDVLHGEGTNLKWTHKVTDEDLERIMQPMLGDTKERSVRMCFINTLDTNASWLPGNFEIRAQTLRILLKAGLSKALLANIYSKQCYWAKMGNQRFLRYNTDGSLKTFEISYQYRCGWDTGVSFVDFVRTPSQSVYFLINYPTYALTRLKAAVNSNPRIAHRDFFPDTLVADDSLKQWQYEIGHRRDTLQSYEKQYEDEGTNFKQATIQLHRLARHWLTLGQDYVDFQAQLGFLRESYVKYKEILAAQSPSWDIDKAVDMCESFEMLISQCDTCIRWTKVYHERTNLRINLLFHLVNQRESRTNTQIATSTAEVARQTQRDSASMITIAAVTMLFLPGTFISAILSTTFFDYGDDGLHVSGKWWILLASTIPLTVVVFGVWLGWRYVRLRKQKAEVPVKLPS